MLDSLPHKYIHFLNSIKKGQEFIRRTRNFILYSEVVVVTTVLGGGGEVIAVGTVFQSYNSGQLT